MVRRIAAVLLALTLAVGSASADIAWKQDTPAQIILKDYVTAANARLAELGELPINTTFEPIYSSFAVFGITAAPDAETPEGVEITIRMLYDSLDRLELRVSDLSRFPNIAAALILALYGDALTPEEALSVPQDRAAKAAGAPGNSFEEPVEELSGTTPRMYYAYYPNQYRDGVNWMQMTMIFPLPGTWDGSGMVVGETPEKIRDASSDASEDYEGYYSQDDYSHLEVFVTATPEPDSAAAEYDFR